MLMTTSAPDRLLETIRSRCEFQVRFPSLAPAEICEILSPGFERSGQRLGGLLGGRQATGRGGARREEESLGSRSPWFFRRLPAAMRPTRLGDAETLQRGSRSPRLWAAIAVGSAPP